MADIVELLQRLGWSEYEARAYLTLLRESPLNGYHLARLSGIPRANIYAVLQKLEERGAVLRLESPSGVRYGPTAPDQLVGGIRGRLDDVLRDVEESLGRAPVAPADDYVWNLHGRDALLDHARALFASSRRSLFIATWPQESRELADAIQEAAGRSVRLNTFCLAPCANECGACRGHIFRYRMPPEQRSRWLILNADDQELLAGEIGPGDEALAVRTRQRLLVDAVTWYMRHSVALGGLLTDAGDRLPDLITPETRSVLQEVGPDEGEGWLPHMLDLLSRPPASPDALRR